MNNSMIAIGLCIGPNGIDNDVNKIKIDHIVLVTEDDKEYPLYYKLLYMGTDKQGKAVVSLSGCSIYKEDKTEYNNIEIDSIMQSVVSFYPVYNEESDSDYEFIMEEIGYCCDVYTPIIEEKLEEMNLKIEEMGGVTLDISKLLKMILMEIENPFVTLKIHNDIKN